MSSQSRRSRTLRGPLDKSAATATQRDQLSALVLNRFIKDYAQNKPALIEAIRQEVLNFFANEKVTQENLRLLKEKVKKLVVTPGLKLRSLSMQEPKKDEKVEPSLPPIKGIEAAPVAPEEQRMASRGSQRSRQTNNSMVSRTSAGKKSVYVAQGDGADEWATLVKFDVELFKKEKELVKLMESDRRQRLKAELDAQLREKEERKAREAQVDRQFQEIQQRQGMVYDQKERDKVNQMSRKLQAQKLMRDKQVREERRRRREEVKANSMIEKQIVEQVAHELSQEKEEVERKKREEKERFRKMREENQQNLRRLQEEQSKEKEEDIRLQREYQRLLQEQEAKRQAQKRERQEKAQKALGKYADNVLRSQQEHVRAEQQKMEKYYKQIEEKERHEETTKRARVGEWQREMRHILAKQVQERRQKSQREMDADRDQAAIWEKDMEQFRKHQAEQQKYLQGVYGQHKAVLMEQMRQKQSGGQRRMNTLELLYNKALIKQAAGNEASNLKKETLS